MRWYAGEQKSQIANCTCLLVEYLAVANMVAAKAVSAKHYRRAMALAFVQTGPVANWE